MVFNNKHRCLLSTSRSCALIDTLTPSASPLQAPALALITLIAALGCHTQPRPSARPAAPIQQPALRPPATELTPRPDAEPQDRPQPVENKEQKTPDPPTSFAPIPDRRPGGFPGLAFASARAFAFNLDVQERPPCLAPLDERGERCVSVHGEGVELNEVQLKTLMVLLGDRATYGDDEGKCFIPRHGVVFYDAAGAPVAWVSICFECNHLRSAPELPAQRRADPMSGFTDLGAARLKAFFSALPLR